MNHINITKKNIIFFFVFLNSHLFIYAQSKQECDSLNEKAINDIWQQKFVEAFDILFKVKNISENESWSAQNFLATNALGTIYLQINDNPNALKYYIDAYEIAWKAGLYDEATVAMNNIAIIYAKDNDFINAIKYFELAISNIQKGKPKSELSPYYANLAEVYYNMGDLETSKTYIQKARENQFNSETRLYAGSEIIYLKILLKENKINEVVNRGENLVQLLAYTSFEGEKIETYLILASCYSKLNRYSQAWYYFNEGLLKCINPKMKLEFFQIGANISTQQQFHSKAMAFKDSINLIQREVFLSEQKLDMEKYKVKFELANTRKQLELSNQKSTLQKQVYGLSIIILLSSASILLLFFYNKAKNAQKSKELAERNIKIAHLELENNTSALRIRDSEIREKEHQLEISRLQTEKEKQEALLLEQQLLEKEIRNQLKIKESKEKEIEALLEQEKLKVEIELRNKLLLDKIAFQESRNETIKSLIGGIELEMKGSLSIKKITDKLKSELEKEAEWDNFLLKSNNISTKILESIKQKHPSLSAKDLRFIYYIYQKLDTKEIAELLNITSEGCRKRKERIGKKLNLEPHQNLFDYILTFELEY